MALAGAACGGITSRVRLSRPGMVMLMVCVFIALNQATCTRAAADDELTGDVAERITCSATRLIRPARAVSSVSIAGSSAPRPGSVATTPH